MFRTRVGYAGGSTADPTYRRIGDHTECVQVDFAPELVSYEELLDAFFGVHDPTRRAPSTQYASLVLVHDDAQRVAAEASVRRYSSLFGAQVLTVVKPLETFYLAEDYHQKYGLRSEPLLVREMRRYYPDEAGLRESTAAMRLNGFAYEGGRASLMGREIGSYGLGPEGEAYLKTLAGRR